MATNMVEGESPSSYSVNNNNNTKRPTTMKGSSIHTIGQGKIGKINAKYPFVNKTSSSCGNNSNGNTTTTNTTTAGNTNTTGGGIISGSYSQSSSENIDNNDHDGDMNVGIQEGNDANDDHDHAAVAVVGNSKPSFNALLSKFGGGKKLQPAPTPQPQPQHVVSNVNARNSLRGNTTSSPSVSVDTQQQQQQLTAAAAPQSSSTDNRSPPPSEPMNVNIMNNGNGNSNRDDSIQNNDIPSPSPPLVNSKIPSFLKPIKSNKPSSSSLQLKPPPLPPPQAGLLPPPNGSNDNTDAISNSHSLSNNINIKQQQQTRTRKSYGSSSVGAGGGGGGGSIASSAKNKFSFGNKKQQQASAAADQLKKKLSPRNLVPQNLQLGPLSHTRPKTVQRTMSNGAKSKSKFASQQQQQMMQKPSKSMDHHSLNNNINISMSIDSGSSPRRNSNSNSNSNSTGGMIQRKSQQRLVLEQVAAQYFLNEHTKNTNNNGNSGRRNARYAGAVGYGEGNNNNNSGDNNDNSQFLGNIDESRPSVGNTPVLGLSVVTTPGVNEDRIGLFSFLGGDDDDDNDGDGVVTTTNANANDTSKKKSTAEQQAQAIQQETDIDRILEMASDHLSLGKNDLALQAYRRAMKCAFAEVLSVKQKLVEVKKKQQQYQQHQGDSSSSAENELGRKQEKQFELSLLQVASRVADIHNNMGVVHEMNRHYQKAKQSYADALEVYHNTCKRFEEKGDPDVDRTKKNVERMALACNSEGERKALHEKARKIAKSVEREKHFTQRKLLLNQAISTLKRALELESETIGSTHPVAASTLVQIGKYHYENRAYDNAEWGIRKAITILRNALGPLHPQVGKTTLLLASIYERHGLNGIAPRGESKEDVELELYVDALEPLKATLGEVHGEVGYLYVKIGYLYGKKGDVSLSLLAYKAALKAYGEPSPASLHNPEVVSIWVRVVEHLTALKSWDEAVVAGRRALFLLRRCKNTLFRDVKLLSSNHSGSGATISSGGTSITSQQPPLPKPTNRSSKKSPIQITSDTYHNSISKTLQCLGQAHTSLSNYPLARDACEEALQLAWEMALSSNGSNTGATAEETQLAAHSSVLRVIHALKRLGKAQLLERHYAPALECFLPALELLRSSPETEATLDCASVLGSLGFLYLKLKRYTESSNFLRECLRLYTRNGVSTNDRETRKVQAWLQMAESREEEAGVMPPSFLEIPTIVFHDENSDSRFGSI